YGLASNVVVRPDSTVVYAPASKLNRMSSISTEEIQLSNLSEYHIEQTNLKDFPGFSYNYSTARVILDVQRIVDKNFSEIPVKIIDVPNDRNVVLLPNKINVGVRGGIDILGKLNQDDINAHLL